MFLMHEHPSEHSKDADRIQAAIYRRMKPEQRLAQAVRMNRQMRGLMDAGLRLQKPEWTEAERRREIARRILFSVTG
ncbi:hypothetical protein OpiT1DRAFT_01814 [Opitutaceae bacterium TAV1]|nr:hypothetical protein OpiT1DRAFT_01814 [Opitutaceae bacterium TAV1]